MPGGWEGETTGGVQKASGAGAGGLGGIPGVRGNSGNASFLKEDFPGRRRLLPISVPRRLFGGVLDFWCYLHLLLSKSNHPAIVLAPAESHSSIENLRLPRRGD